MLIIFRDISIFQKYPNLTFFKIYFCKINILPSAWDHQMQNCIKIHIIQIFKEFENLSFEKKMLSTPLRFEPRSFDCQSNRKKILTSFYENYDTFTMAQIIGELKLLTGSIYLFDNECCTFKPTSQTSCFLLRTSIYQPEKLTTMQIGISI